MSDWDEAVVCQSCSQHISRVLSDVSISEHKNNIRDTTILPWKDNSKTVTYTGYSVKIVYACECSEWRAASDNEPPSEWGLALNE